MTSTMRTYNKVGPLEAVLAALHEDPILADVPTNASLADINTLISVELGSAMKLSVLKMDNTTFGMGTWT